MHPNSNEPEIYVTHTQPGYVLPAAIPSDSTPPPYGAPYISSRSTTRYPIRTQKWSTGLCRCLDDPANCKNQEIMCFFFYT